MTGFAYEAVVNLKTLERESSIRIYNVQVPLSPGDYTESDIEIIRSDSRVQKRCAKHGISDMSLVSGGPWGMSSFERGRASRLNGYFLYVKNYLADNHYGHPLNIFVILDLDTRSVVSVEDLPTHDSSFNCSTTDYTTPKRESNYDYELRGGASFLRQDDNPITVKSPDGVSFKVEGYQVQWQKWSMRIGYNGREGLVLNTVTYDDNGIKRPIMYRASLVETFTPYGDPRPPFHNKAAFDTGEFGIGYNFDPLTVGEDIIGSATLVNVILHNTSGSPIVHPNAISIREEDAGILWKHVDYRFGKGSLARSHRLVISTISTFGNYEYIFSWYFYQDASIQFLAQLTGLISNHVISVDSLPPMYGTIIAPQIQAPYHQHIFTVRLDVDIDGNNNTVSTLDILPTKSTHGQAFAPTRTPLTTFSKARTNISPHTGRTWAFTNPSKLNIHTKKPVGWKLVAPPQPPLLMKEDSPLRKKLGFLNYSVWVTPYQDGQLYPGGLYLNGSGLPEWVENNPDANVENEDVVVWYNFGLIHISTAEQFPVMSVENVGFWLRPFNFFSENPAMDVPPPTTIF